MPAATRAGGQIAPESRGGCWWLAASHSRAPAWNSSTSISFIASTSLLEEREEHRRLLGEVVRHAVAGLVGDRRPVVAHVLDAQVGVVEALGLGDEHVGHPSAADGERLAAHG